MYNFNTEKETQICIAWIKDWFETKSGNANGVVIGISGGKDSTVVAKLCAEAIGKDKVIGVLMPNGEQKDISDSLRVCETVGIKHQIVNIKDAYTAIEAIGGTPEAMINIAPRLRMTTLYYIAQTKSYRVAGTGNASEKYIGYCTKWGDMACDFNPIANFTSDEVIEIGDFLGLPYELVHKTPNDGLSGLSDEEKIGFTYADLNRYIRIGVCENPETKAKIDKMHMYALHKLEAIPVYPH